MYPERDNLVSTTHQSDHSVNNNDAAMRVPSISLPKGGGAIRGIGEKFVANPVTGSGSMSVPLSITPGRAGFGPQLSLSYDSGAGNGAFGFGWNLALPSINRKTDKGLPQYHDAAESDVFILSGAEDLVPELTASGGRFEDSTSVADYTVHRYRPRIEGLFARIERWTNKTDASDTFWRSISRDNITTWYGKTAESRIVDPNDAKRIFTWFICESYDDKGNAIRYEYKRENSDGVDLAATNEKNRNRAAQRYLKHVKYGNSTPRRTNEDLAQRRDWLFELVFDYGEHDELDPKPSDTRAWLCRHDPFSTYRAGFEVRSYRLCRRVLMFHHFQEEEIGRDCLVKSTDIAYHEGPIASFVDSIRQTGYKRKAGGGYLKKSLPPLEFQYSEAVIDETIREVDSDSLENLPIGSNGGYQWVDLDGEGVPGILTEQANAWFYKRNLSPIFIAQENGEKHNVATFAPVELVAEKPTVAGLGTLWQIQDLDGDGSPDLACFNGPIAGFFERNNDTDTWESFMPFRALPNVDFHDPNLRFIDLTGDGRADILITEDDAFTWYASLGETGFAASERTRQAFDEERGPQLVFADREQTIYLADLSGDGLTDLVRIRNGEVCYWPNLGYGRFGAKVTMDGAPWFDEPDQFDRRRIHLADIDGSGVVDIIYVAAGEVRLYFNRSGNRWSDARVLANFPALDSLSSVQVVDLLGNGTACLVWSSQLPGAEKRQLRYIDLMGGQKPHLLVKTVNNLGAETEVHYAPSTKFYLADKFAGRPWITKLSFPVHVVEKATMRDKWRQTEFSSTYSYHHGYFDGIEREFRGFGRVERVDVESFGTFAAGNVDSPYIADDKTLYQPPVKTITWFHTGAALDRKRILTQLSNEYFPTSLAAMPGYSAVLSGFNEKLLPEPDLDSEDLSTDEWRQALRACKGMVLRQEVYELDVDQLEAGKHAPVRLFSTATHNCHVRRLQPNGQNRHAVFLVTESEALTYNYELDLHPVTFPGDPRNIPALTPDPRVAHKLNLSIDELGNVQQLIAIGYKRARQFSDPEFTADQVALIREVQNEQHLVYTETRYTNDAIEPAAGSSRIQHYRLRVPAEVQTYQLTGFTPATGFYFDLEDLRSYALSDTLPNQGPLPVKTIEYHELPSLNIPEQRKVEHALTLFFDEDLKTPLAHGRLNHLGLTYESYKLALTTSLLKSVLRDKFDGDVLNALDAPAACGYLPGTNLLGAAGNEQWWQRSGVAGFADDAADHFYLPERYTDPFGNETTLSYDGKYDLFIQSSTDALGNQTRIFADPQLGVRFDYRVLSPIELEDINGNRSEVWYDVLGMVIAAAVKGKGNEADNLNGYTDELANPDLAELLSHFDLPPMTADDLSDHFNRVLGNATTRFLYHFGEEIEDGRTVFAARPAGACTIVREQHVAQLAPRANSRLQIGFECSDGQGNVLMKRSQAEPEAAGGSLRWVVNGKTVLNNKGKPVKQYEPYFSRQSSCRAEGDPHEEAGVTPLMYYDAAGRLVRTEMPDGTFSRVEFSPWHSKAFDANDTVVESHWYRERNPPPLERPLPRDPITGELTVTPAQRAAWLAGQHFNTPAQMVFDSLGREAVAIVNNRVKDPNGPYVFGGERYRDERYFTFTKLDAEGKPLWIRDARGNLVMQFITPVKATRWTDESNEHVPSGSVPAYDIAGNTLFQHSMDAGDRWMLNDAGGKPVFAWDFNARQDDAGTVIDEERLFFTRYDALHRPTEHWLTINKGTPNLIERYTYGEQLPDPDDARARNLRGQLYQHHDQSGLSQPERLDFKGNLLELHRTLGSQYNAPVIDWQSKLLPPRLEAETFVRISEFDALNRMTRLYNWHRGVGSRVAVYVPGYNERGALVSETIDVGAIKTAKGHTPSANGPTNALVEIRYDAKGQKEFIRYGNETITRYHYDPQRFRLAQLRTTRPAFDPPFPNPPSSLKDPKVLQNLHYTYDPVGNITEIRDDAYEPAFFNNQRVEAVSRHAYNALYRLIESTGRENAQAGSAPGEFEDPPFAVQFPVEDANALRNYTQTFNYDPVGNVEQVQHTAINGSWTRHYENAADSNRLLRSWEGNNTIGATQYRYDIHGNTLNLANVAAAQSIRWDYRDMIRAFNMQGGGWAYYNYDSVKQRTRKVIENQSGTKQWERIYLDGLEIYRRYTAGNVVEEIESLHLFAGDQRLLLIDDVLLTDNSNLPVGALFRYHYSNQLGSTCLQVNDRAELISYEEYHPYGTTAYRARNSRIEAPPSRYRYTGMERDEETGLSYHGARYYASWLCRWLSPDPTGIADGVNLFRAFGSNPIGLTDTSGKQAQPARSRPGGPLSLDLAKGLMRADVCYDTPIPSAPYYGPSISQASPNYRPMPVRQQMDPGVAATKAANSIFPPVTQEIFEGTIRGPALGAAAPAVATGMGAVGLGAGTYHLSQGNYAQAQAAFSFSLEVLSNVSPNYVLTPSQKMSLAIREEAALAEKATPAKPPAPAEPAAPAAPAVAPAPPAPAVAAPVLPVPPPPPTPVTLISRMTEIVEREKALLDRAVRDLDPEALRQLGASEGQIKQFFEISPKGKDYYANAYGQVLEARVRAAFIADAELSPFITGTQTTLLRQTAAGRMVKGNPDWAGTPGGPLQGYLFDLTTKRDVTKHLERFYGENMVVFSYEAPPQTWQLLSQ